MNAEAELQDLLQFFYQCPVGLLEADAAGTVQRINPAAVALLTPLFEDCELDDLVALLQRVAPDAVELLHEPTGALGRLERDRRLLVWTRSTEGQPQVGLELQLVRHVPGRVMLVVLDIAVEARLIGRLHDDMIQELFATGLQLERLATVPREGFPDERLIAQVDAIDAVIRRLRLTLTEGPGGVSR